MRLARASGRPEREVDVQATLGSALAWTGRSQQGLALLDRAVAASRGDLTGRVLMRRASSSIPGPLPRGPPGPKPRPALFPPGRRHGMGGPVADPRARVFLGFGLPAPGGRGLCPGRGDVRRHRAGTRVRHGPAQPRAGGADPRRSSRGAHLPRRSSEPLRGARRDHSRLALDRCSALLAAGLAGEAAQETETALSQVPQEARTAYKTAELLFAAATAALAAGDPAEARERAVRRTGCSGHRVEPSRRRAPASSSPRPGYAAGEHTPALLRYAEEVAARLDASRAGEAMQAHLLAGRIALSRGRGPSRPASGARRAGPAAAGRRCRGAWPGWPGPCRPTRGATPGPLSPPAAAGSTRSRSTRCGSAPPSCALTARRTVPSWPCWPSATRSGGATSAGCCSGASDGGPPRWPPSHRRKTRSCGRAGGLAPRERLPRRRPRRPPGADALERERRRLEAAVQARTLHVRGDRPAAKASSTWTAVRPSSARPR